MREIEQKMGEMINGIVSYPSYSSDPIKIKEYIWNKSMEDFEVTYFLGNAKYVFHYNDQFASETGIQWNSWRKRFYIILKECMGEGLVQKSIIRLRKLNRPPGDQLLHFCVD
jgi:hypothetical protein